ncbi:hypothetical protein JCM5296_002390 [Sporobolomyces johnsonii]
MGRAAARPSLEDEGKLPARGGELLSQERADQHDRWDGDDNQSGVRMPEVPLAEYQGRRRRLDSRMPALELPVPAMGAAPEPAPPSPEQRQHRSITNADRRILAAGATPPLRARFDLIGSPPSPSTSGIPLKSILQHSYSPAHPSSIHGYEVDMADLVLGPGSPTFALHEDDKPHPERPTPLPELRAPHPLYTPAPIKRRRRRRRSGSLASGPASHSSKARSRVKRALRRVRAGRRRRGSRSSRSSGSFASTTSGSSRSSTAGSTRSSSTWNGWRFWHTSSSGSSSDDDDDGSDADWEPPTPHFTLLTPHLTRPTLAYPSHLFAGSTSPATRLPSSDPSVDRAPVFGLLSTSTLAPALERLEAFWLERRQDDGVAGDIGAGVAAGAACSSLSPDATSYFPPIVAGDSTTGPVAGSSRTPPATPGVSGGPTTTSKLRAELRVARAEEKRFGKDRAMENGPAWWLDIMCPTVADMRELRKHLPLHPLTIEDILHQETREKMESFPSLGYYFIVFRALDESYFRYTSPDGSAASPEGQDGASTGRRGKVDIVEGVGGKEGVEGVGVGAINLYLIVFGDGILSFHFEPLTRHIERVQGRLQEFGISRNFSSHWIAYSLMDSIVDAFFPLINFIEGESDEVSTFIADPLAQPGTPVKGSVAPSGVGAAGVHKIFDEDVVSISVETPSTEEEKEKFVINMSSSPLRRATVRRRRPAAYLRPVTSFSIPTPLLRLLPQRWLVQKDDIVESSVLVDENGMQLLRLPLDKSAPVLDVTYVSLALARRARGTFGVTKFDKMVMLHRIANVRKLQTGLSRLLGPKIPLVKGLRKRTMEENLGLFKHDAKHDIAVYITDLLDHIVTMQQSLAHYDAILSHDHPSYVGILRLALEGTKLGIDMRIIPLSCIVLACSAISVPTGLSSLNVKIAIFNGDRLTHLRADGSRSPFYAFGILLCISLAVILGVVVFIRLAFGTTKARYRARGPVMSRW